MLMLSCGKSKPDSTPTLISVDKFTIEALPSGESLSIGLTASHDWAVETEDWISVSPSSGKGGSAKQDVAVKIEANTSDARTGKIVFSLVGNDRKVTVTVSQGKGVKGTMTIAEFISKPVSTETFHTISGVITSIEGYEYGNFYMKDDTGEIFVYGLTKTNVGRNDQSFSEIGLREGDFVTICGPRSEYRNEPQMSTGSLPAYYVTHTQGKEPAVNYGAYEFVANSTSAGWLELPATSEGDGLQLINHGMTIGSRPMRNYSLYWDKQKLSPVWVAYALCVKTIGYGKRTDVWDFEPLIDASGQPNLSSSYKSASNGKGYDRGHMLPSASRLAYKANLKTFYYTNMTPQESEFNQGVWQNLEDQVRYWAKNSATDTLYVVTGADFNGAEDYVLDNSSPDKKKVSVPVACYKALLRKSADGYQGCAFYLKQSERNSTLKNYAMSIDELEKKVGQDFFVNLEKVVDKAAAEKIEAADPKSDSWWWSNLKQ